LFLLLLCRSATQWVLALALALLSARADRHRRPRAEWLLGRRGMRQLLVLRAALYWLSMLTWWRALQLMPIGDATAIVYVSPVVTAASSAVFLRAPVSITFAPCLLLALAGTAMVTQPTFLFGPAAAAGGVPRTYGAGAIWASGAAVCAGVLPTLLHLKKVHHVPTLCLLMRPRGVLGPHCCPPRIAGARVPLADGRAYDRGMVSLPPNAVCAAPVVLHGGRRALGSGIRVPRSHQPRRPRCIHAARREHARVCWPWALNAWIPALTPRHYSDATQLPADPHRVLPSTFCVARPPRWLQPHWHGLGDAQRHGQSSGAARHPRGKASTLTTMGRAVCQRAAVRHSVSMCVAKYQYDKKCD
jgi:uncharacterized membrane protein